MHLLVTGGAGFIGANFVRHWVGARPHDRVVVLDALTYAGNRANLAGFEEAIGFVEGDIGDRDLVGDVLADERIDVIVNFAAESHNSLAVLDPTVFFRTNVLGTQTLLEAARATGVSRFHHVSTCEVYGDLALDDPGAFREDSPYRPNTPYSASKAGADHAVRAYGHTFDLPVTLSNCANNYGPFQFPEKVLPLFVTQALDDRALPLYESSAHRREWINVRDHCAAIERILHDGRPGETYNVGTGVEVSIRELADLVLAELGRPDTLKTTVPDRPGHDRRYLLDATKIQRELGWEPTVDFVDGVRDTIRWYAEHRDWWEPLRARAAVAEDGWRAAATSESGGAR